MSDKAIVLLSGGLDSTTCLALAREAGFTAYALTFRYGQRQEIELAAARQAAQRYGVAGHLEIDIPKAVFASSALVSAQPVPKGRSVAAMAGQIPTTYVPARNTLFLSYALALAEVEGAFDIFIGVNALDYSGYPDCRPAFIEAFTQLANLATGAAVEGKGVFKIHTPLLHLNKAEIIKEGLRLGVDYSQTHTCYDPIDGRACGACDACLLRARGFAQAGVADPTLYHQRKQVG